MLSLKACDFAPSVTTCLSPASTSRVITTICSSSANSVTGPKKHKRETNLTTVCIGLTTLPRLRVSKLIQNASKIPHWHAEETFDASGVLTTKLWVSLRWQKRSWIWSLCALDARSIGRRVKASSTTMKKSKNGSKSLKNPNEELIYLKQTIIKLLDKFLI